MQTSNAFSDTTFASFFIIADTKGENRIAHENPSQATRSKRIGRGRDLSRLKGAIAL